jgi:hypothetical protein
VAQNPLPEIDRLKQVYTSHQFFLYEYLDSWPYFYLANRTETISDYEDLYEAEKGVAYLWVDEPKVSFPPRNSDESRFIKLNKFEFGSLEFEYSTNQKEFLVISDAWHPYWHAKINGLDAKIIKTNGVFKGVVLPSGQGKIELFFDNSPYKPGIWISITGWILFLGSWLFFILKTQSLDSSSTQSMTQK